ncbi:MAG: hypothetical protein JO235_15760 [Chroococcidiopsidaceae cyanobacterium CP_BM_RX_35]|nr:hypothetical protein [Chroococcidiopsidaceae cyanobacterium CP_BM_RX_35]
MGTIRAAVAESKKVHDYDPTQLNDLEMLQLIALGLIPYLERVLAPHSQGKLVEWKH